MPRKPLPLRSAHLSSEPTAPTRYSRRREGHCKSVTEDSRVKSEPMENRFSQANSYNSIIDASVAAAAAAVSSNLRTNNTLRLVRCVDESFD